MLVLIETVEGKVVWVNPAYVTDVNELYLPKEGSNARSVYVTRGLESPRIYYTFEDMFPLVERLNEAKR